MTAIFVEKASGQTNSVIIIFPKQSGTKTRFLLQSISTGFALQELTKKVTQSVSLIAIAQESCYLLLTKVSQMHPESHLMHVKRRRKRKLC